MVTSPMIPPLLNVMPPMVRPSAALPETATPSILVKPVIPPCISISATFTTLRNRSSPKELPSLSRSSFLWPKDTCFALLVVLSTPIATLYN